MSLTLTTSSGTATFSDPTAGFTAGGAGQFHLGKGKDKGGNFRKQKINSWGSSGNAVNRGGFKDRKVIDDEVVYVAASANAAHAALAAHRAILENLKITATRYGQSIPSAELLDDGFESYRMMEDKQSGNFLLFCRISFEQLRTS